jgi:hypothetical protein
MCLQQTNPLRCGHRPLLVLAPNYKQQLLREHLCYAFATGGDQYSFQPPLKASISPLYLRFVCASSTSALADTHVLRQYQVASLLPKPGSASKREDALQAGVSTASSITTERTTIQWSMHASGSVFAMDANRYLARPGPSLLPGCAVVAAITWFHDQERMQRLRGTGLLPPEGTTWGRVDVGHLDAPSLRTHHPCRSGVATSGPPHSCHKKVDDRILPLSVKSSPLGLTEGLSSELGGGSTGRPTEAAHRCAAPTSLKVPPQAEVLTCRGTSPAGFVGDIEERSTGGTCCQGAAHSLCDCDSDPFALHN